MIESLWFHIFYEPGVRPQTVNFELSWDALAPRRHPGSTQKAPGGTQEARDILESECVISYAPAHKSDASDHFRVHGSDVTITV